MYHFPPYDALSLNITIKMNQFNPLGHYQQDANTYAEWGVDCKMITVICMYSFVSLQMLKWTGAIQKLMAPNWILTNNMLKWYTIATVGIKF